MTSLRYDPDEDKSRHAAADESCCEEMAQKYDWQLVDVEPIRDNDVFKADCVFDGETEFPKSYYDTDREDD
jgi:hypothetical protein